MRLIPSYPASVTGRARVTYASLVIAFTLMWGGTAVVLAQAGGTLTVRVVDQTGGALPNASVVVQRGDGTAPPSAAAVTDAVGKYATTGLVPGRYQIAVSLDGFLPGKSTANVRADRVAEITVVLLVRHDEVIKVPGLRIGLPNSLTGMTFSGAALDRLPNGEIDLLAHLRDLAGTRGRPGDVAIYVDGFRDFRRLPPKASIELIQINADPYSTEFSEPGTRRIEILTKPGADGTFGELKAEINDESLNARDPLATSKPQLQRRTYSAYFSAPIIRQKWGFYVYAGGWEEDENASIRATTLNGALEPTPFLETLSAPMRTTNLTFSTGWALGSNHRLKAEYSRDGVTARNQGLENGLTLPERGYSTETTTDAARFSLLSVLGTSAVYELRVQAKRHTGDIRANSSATGIVVADAFSAGGNQYLLAKTTTTDSVQFDTKMTKSLGGHTFRLGVQGDHARVVQLDRANFGGTFVFGADVERDSTGAPVVGANGTATAISPLERYRRTLLGLPGYGPSSFTLTSGNPAAAVRQWTASAFLQDDWIQSANLTVSGGVRAEAQSNVSRKIDVAPRLGLTWAIGAKGGVIRSGSGLFYTRVDPSVTLDTIRFDGQRQQQYLVPAPDFFPVPELTDAEAATTVMTKAAGMRTGRVWVSNIGYERSLFGPLFASVTYTHERGERLTRLTDINTPEEPGGPRPIPSLGEILQFQSVGTSTRREVQVGVRADFEAGSYILVNYTRARTFSNTDGPRTLPSDARDLAGEWGPVATDERHRVFVSGLLSLPGQWMLIPSFTYGSPRPFNITTGFDNNLDGHLTDRPSFAAPGASGAVQTPYGLLNPSPDPGETIVPRNFGRGSRLLRADVSLAKVFLLKDSREGRRTLALHVSAKNLLNTASLGDYNGVLLSPLFGTANTAQRGRQVTFGFGFSF